MVIALSGKKVDASFKPKLVNLFKSLGQRDVELYFHLPYYLYLTETLQIVLPDCPLFEDASQLPSDTSFLLAVGGDGTFLKAVSIVGDRNIPIAGVNFGHLGFLTTVQPTEDESWIDDLISGKYVIQKRMLLKVTSDHLPEGLSPYAVNEVSLQRQTPSMLGVRIKVNGRPLPVFWSDGILVSTPTGSTAYNLSVGGPIVDPSSNVIIISPIAPHNLNVRPIVIPADSQLEISYESSRKDDARVTIDNRFFGLPDNGKIFVSTAEFEFQYIGFSNTTFISALKEKLMWGEDKRNTR